MSPAQAAKIMDQKRIAQEIISRMPSKASDCRCTTAVGKLIVLSGKKLKNGSMFNPRTKSLGCGVVQVWYEELY